VLTPLGSHASWIGYRRLVLETGNRQGAAVALYEQAGYQRIAPFGPHVGDPTSLCFERVLAA